MKHPCRGEADCLLKIPSVLLAQELDHADL